MPNFEQTVNGWNVTGALVEIQYWWEIKGLCFDGCDLKSNKFTHLKDNSSQVSHYTPFVLSFAWI